MTARRRSLLDRAIEAAAPQWALRRAAARSALAMFGASDSYPSTDPRRRTLRGWSPRATSADAATLPALSELRAQSRDLVRGNPIAGGAIATAETSAVGTGLTVQPEIAAEQLGLDPEQAEEWQCEAKHWFELWAGRPEWCDAAAALNFYQLTALAFRSALESGDVFGLLPMFAINDEPLQTKVQMIEADRVCNPLDRQDGAEDWWAGMRVDDYGRALQVAIARHHPGGAYRPGSRTADDWSIVDVIGRSSGRRNVLHLAQRLRPGQRRGVPMLAPVIETIKQIGRYTENEVQAAVISAAFTVFITQAKPETGPLGSSSTPPGTAPTATAGNPSPNAPNEVKLDSGAILDLAPGEDVKFADPTRPNPQFDAFVTACFVQIGIALEIPYEVLVSRFTASYSAARAALLRFYLSMRRRRDWVAAGWCQPIYEAVITEAVLRGYIAAPGFMADPVLRACWLRATWIGDAPGAINPADEANAAKTRLEIGISDKNAETIAFSGRNWSDVQRQRARERAREIEDGTAQTAPAPGATNDPNAGQATPPADPNAPEPGDGETTDPAEQN